MSIWPSIMSEVSDGEGEGETGGGWSWSWYWCWCWFDGSSPAQLRLGCSICCSWGWRFGWCSGRLCEYCPKLPVRGLVVSSPPHWLKLSGITVVSTAWTDCDCRREGECECGPAGEELYGGV